MIQKSFNLIKGFRGCACACAKEEKEEGITFR